MLDSDVLLVWKHVGNETARLTNPPAVLRPRKSIKYPKENKTCVSSFS